jgi:hypothetical protein
MRSAMFYLLHSTAIISLMGASYFYGLKHSAKEMISKKLSDD